MKKTVLTFGLISGAIMAAMMFGTMLFIRNIGFDKAEIVGYTGMVLAFLLVFFGIRSYRENVGGGTISFGRAFAVGALIMLISTACYVIAWEIIFQRSLQQSLLQRSDYFSRTASRRAHHHPDFFLNLEKERHGRGPCTVERAGATNGCVKSLLFCFTLKA